MISDVIEGNCIKCKKELTIENVYPARGTRAKKFKHAKQCSKCISIVRENNKAKSIPKMYLTRGEISNRTGISFGEL